MNKIGIKINGNFFYPEAYAYSKYLKNLNYKVDFIKNKNDFRNYNLIIKFMGIDYDKFISNQIVIHDYASVSTYPLPKIKNKIKKLVNKKPNGRIFLNETVKLEMNFNDNLPYIYRDMGIDNNFFNLPQIPKIFDIIYSGSFKNRLGLIKRIEELAKKGLNIALIGNISNKQIKLVSKFSNIKIFGVLPRYDLYEIYAQSKIGLNFYPNIYPFNFQTSTKVLEYMASGLGILSNSYKWINYFEKKNDSNFLYYNESLSKDQILNFNYRNGNLEKYEWDNLLSNIKFEKFIKSFL